MTLGELKYILSLTAQQFFNTLQAASKEYNKEKKNIEGRPITFKASGVDDIIRKLALFAGGALAVRSVSDEFRAFQTDLANVESLGVPNIEELKGSILSLAVETPVPIRDLNKGLYDVVSAGVDSANQIKVLDVTARGAKAGLAQT
ncbi:MAG: hypothetical protein KDD04_03015, partial [Sinomicrobium sp.]|nr:hypothetical protein [Sinomicrobium sp.]